MQMIFFGFLFIVIKKAVVTAAGIRLINGGNPLEGKLQLLKDGFWSSFCYDYWRPENTKVACRMLTKNTYRQDYSYQRWEGDCMYNVTCYGNEQAIYECMTGVIYKRCLSIEAVAVRCGAEKISSSRPSLSGIGVRLVDGYTQNEGKIEVLVNGTWKSVANTNNSWGNKEANVICRMLGYSTNNASGFHAPTLIHVQCTGIETSIELCSFKKGHYCELDRHVSLYCSCIATMCNGSTTYCDLTLGTCEPACSPGRYLSGSYCHACNAGTFQPASNQNRCYLCSFGTYQNLTGQSSCKPCPVGKYSNMVGKAECDACLPGTYQNQTGQMSCKQCDLATYQNISEQAACMVCEPGSYQNSTGKTACIPCTEGKTTIGPGSINQYECYKRQRDDRRQQTSFEIFIIGATLLAVAISFDIISCAILLRRMSWDNRKDRNTEINLSSLKQNEFGSQKSIRHDTLNPYRSPDMKVSKRVYENAALHARHESLDQESEQFQVYANTVDMYDVISED